MAERKKEMKINLSKKGEPLSGSATSMRLSNPTKQHLYFRIITSPALMCFTEPNNGVIKPNGKIDIYVFVKEIPTKVDIVINTIPSNANFHEDEWTNLSKIIPYNFSWDFTVGSTPSGSDHFECVTYVFNKTNELVEEIDILKTNEISLKEENMKLKEELLVYQDVVGKIKNLTVKLPPFEPMGKKESKPEKVATSQSEIILKQNIDETIEQGEGKLPQIKVVDYETLQKKEATNERDILIQKAWKESLNR